MEQEPKSKDDNDGSLKNKLVYLSSSRKSVAALRKKGNKRLTFRQLERGKILNRLYLILINLLLLAQEFPKVKH